MAHCRISWDSYKNNISKGFHRLQQTEEFVDMTLAADGHLVKIHKSLLALASPYIKEMLQSAPCQHPVLFLNQISYEVLCYILEYIYAGEVEVPIRKMNAFIQASKALQITGVSDLIPPTTNMLTSAITPVKNIGNIATRNECSQDRLDTVPDTVYGHKDDLHINLENNRIQMPTNNLIIQPANNETNINRILGPSMLIDNIENEEAPVRDNTIESEIINVHNIDLNINKSVANDGVQEQTSNLNIQPVSNESNINRNLDPFILFLKSRNKEVSNRDETPESDMFDGHDNDFIESEENDVIHVPTNNLNILPVNNDVIQVAANNLNILPVNNDGTQLPTNNLNILPVNNDGIQVHTNNLNILPVNNNGIQVPTDNFNILPVNNNGIQVPTDNFNILPVNNNGIQVPTDNFNILPVNNNGIQVPTDNFNILPVNNNGIQVPTDNFNILPVNNNGIQVPTNNFNIQPESNETNINYNLIIEGANLSCSNANDDRTDHTMSVDENSAPMFNYKENIDTETRNPKTDSTLRINNVPLLKPRKPRLRKPRKGNDVEDMMAIDSDLDRNDGKEPIAESNTDIVIQQKRRNEAVAVGANIINHSEPINKDYCINVEMPTGSKDPPVITINAGVLENQICQSVAGAPSESTAVQQQQNDFAKILTENGGNTPLYMSTFRGSLLMILNRFMYYEHHTAKYGRVRRWRCLDYRQKHCPAYLETDGELIISRKFVHNHPFHDEKIMKRGSNGKVFTSIQQLQEKLLEETEEKLSEGTNSEVTRKIRRRQ